MTKKKSIPHGTYNGYKNYKCRCVACTKAHTKYTYELIAKRADMMGPCIFPDCEFGQYAKGLCKAHYERQRTGLPLIEINTRWHPNRKGSRRS